MSNRLHIGPTDSTIYECVLTSADGAAEKLASELFPNGPFKVRIGDLPLFTELQPVIRSVFEDYGWQYPDAIWWFYCGESKIEHPSQDELDHWLDSLRPA